MRLLLATASNDAYMPLLRSLLASLKPFIIEPLFANIGCLDVGLNTENRTWLRAQNVHVVEPQWDLPVDPQLRRSSPHLRAQTARPFLREYFPGYDMYLWMDCDTWVQERFAVDWLLHAARDGTLAIVPEWDRAYLNNHIVGVANKSVDSLLRYGFCPEVACRELFQLRSLRARGRCAALGTLGNTFRARPERHPGQDGLRSNCAQRRALVRRAAGPSVAVAVQLAMPSRISAGQSPQFETMRTLHSAQHARHHPPDWPH